MSGADTTTLAEGVAEGVAWRTVPGLSPYAETVAAMRARAGAIRDGTAGEAVWLLEHPALYTAGTSARAEDLVAPGRFPVFDAGRGGQWTYHGPGQRVGYVMLDLSRRHGEVPARDVRGFVHGLEEWLIRTVGRFGVRGERRAGRVGIWVETPEGECKVAALGVRLTRWVSWHGVALNVAPELEHFGGIVPCGIAGHGVTSLRALGVEAGMAEVDAALREAWGEVFGDRGGSGAGSVGRAGRVTCEGGPGPGCAGGVHLREGGEACRPGERA